MMQAAVPVLALPEGSAKSTRSRCPPLFVHTTECGVPRIRVHMPAARSGGGYVCSCPFVVCVCVCAVCRTRALMPAPARHCCEEPFRSQQFVDPVPGDASTAECGAFMCPHVRCPFRRRG